jgi:GWxTD domain-containing protein
MRALAHCLQTPAARALGWMLFHFLWQGAAIAAVLALALPRMRTARVRYRAACLALAAMPVVCVVTFVTVLPEQTHRLVALVALPHAPDGSASPIGPPPGFGAADLPVWAVPVWLAGVLLLEVRTLAGWMAARRLRRSGVCAAPAVWRERLAGLAERMRISRPVALVESCRVDVPVVIGYFRPVILAPLALLAGMPPGQVEAILLHELAHIRRRDYLINLLQAIVESLLFYHPVVWWISGLVRAERENCCDDLVLAARGNAGEYAAALTALEETRWVREPAVQPRQTKNGFAGDPSLAATGGNLVLRIHRILGHSEPPHAGWKPALSAGLMLAAGVAVLVVSIGAGHARPQDTAVSPYQKWLNEDVVYIIEARERTAFQQLTTDEEREHFIEQFWLRRDPTPGTVENEFKEEHYRRIAYANRHYAPASGTPGWRSDRGRIYITFGPPDEIEAHPSGGGAHNYPYEQWLYHYIQGIGNNVIVEFDDPSDNGEYRMTKDPQPAR